MPRSGDGSSHNGPFDEAGHSVAHGVGDAGTDKVARADKTAPMPEPEKGLAVEGLGASGGQSQGIKQGPNAGQGGSGSSN
ncbi:hypothetical protein HRG_004398 [Hirsutella rhossiliensis]|uniref:Uncharacterized protein n=1 Tax=Hirsutella rhossiliensis TaxID=111463 RepID=A0A9P8MZ59_9HYPO|nr:uncharacterized protein HRG_04398 [Hirsutella rhossiliensis]KAH0963970.1 hypothetical protein HRG_04398 [Hirsutella rhossiliensis]